MPNGDEDYLKEMGKGGQTPPDGPDNGLTEENERAGEIAPTTDP